MTPVGLARGLAERLPASDLRILSEAAAGGRPGLLALRSNASAAVLRAACDDLLEVLPSCAPEFLAGLLAGAGAVMDAGRARRGVEVVWTGPHSGVTTGRLTAAVVAELVDAACREILLVSYATHPDSTIAEAMHRASDRGVELTLLVERNEDNPSYSPHGAVFADLPAIRLAWPAAQRPQGASMHAKVIVVDARVALIGSANLTGHAMGRNLECGVVLRGGTQPGDIVRHVRELLKGVKYWSLVGLR